MSLQVYLPIVITLPEKWGNVPPAMISITKAYAEFGEALALAGLDAVLPELEAREINTPDQKKPYTGKPRGRRPAGTPLADAAQ